MSAWRLLVLFIPTWLFLCIVGGCSDVPKAPPRFKIEPAKAAEEAMRLYDKNQDGTLDAKELEASPPLQELLSNLKKSEPGHADSLTAADIRKRIEDWLAGSAVLMSASFMVDLDGKPLADATVVFEPEPFLGPSFRAHRGKTDVAGNVELDPEFPEYPHTIYVGLYRVHISKTVDGKDAIPAKYNSQTTLGREIWSGIRDKHASIVFHLHSE